MKNLQTSKIFKPLEIPQRDPEVFEPYIHDEKKKSQKPIPKAITGPHLDRYCGFVRKWKKFETQDKIPYWNNPE